MPVPPPLKPASIRLPAVASSLNALHPYLWIALMLAVAFVQIIVWWFTPDTYLLDEVKVKLFFCMGPILMLVALGAILLKLAPVPPPAIKWGLVGYSVVIVLSTLLSEHPWIGKFYVVFHWASLGFFLVAFVISTHREGSYWLVRYMVILLLIEVLIGFFLIDLTHSVEHHSGITFLRDLIYGRDPNYMPTKYHNLLNTLVGADSELQSTILNRDFFAGFCCMLVPFAYLLAFYPGERRPLLWRTIGIVTSLLGSLTIFWCKSKGEWITWAVAIVVFIWMFFAIGHFKLRDLARGHLLAWIIAIAILGGTLGWMQSPTMMVELKTTSSSFVSRQIIWAGAWKMFMKDVHNMIIGGGPGTFRVYFTQFRRPDYYLHGINNVTTLSHNYFMDVLSETGLVGLMTFFVFLGGQFVTSFRHSLRKSHELDLRLTLAATMIGLGSMYLHNMTSPSGRWVIGATPLWTGMGLLSGLVYQAQKGSFRPAHVEGAVATVPASIPEPLRSLLAAARKYSVAALFLLGCFMAGWGWMAGNRYFDSQKEYAIGLSWLENANARMMERDAQIDQILFMLQNSIKNFNESIHTDPTNTSTYYKVGSAYTSVAQLNNQIAQSFQSKGDSASANSYSAQSDDYLREAKKSYETLMSYDPDYAEIHYNMGIIYQFYSDLIRRGIERKDPDPEFTMDNMKKYNDLALHHLSLMGKTSYKPDVSTLAGNQFASMGYFDKARDVFRDASRRASANEEMIMNYYTNALKVNDYPGVCEALEMLWLRRPDKDQWLEQLVQVAAGNHFDKVLTRVIDRLEHINPIHPKLFEAKIELAKENGDLKGVLAAVDGYIRCDGQDLELYVAGAFAAEKLGLQDKARDIYSRIAKVDSQAKTPAGQAARKWLKGPEPVAAATPAPAPATPAPAPAAPAKAPEAAKPAAPATATPVTTPTK